MDLQFWIYLILAIIYVVSRAMKKAQDQPKDIPGPDPGRQVRYDTPNPPVEKPKQLSFEELLREITEAKQPKPVQQPVEPQPQYERAERYASYDDRVGEEEQYREDVNYDYRKKDKLYDDYEEGKRLAFMRPSLEETMKAGDTDIKFGKFQVFEEKKKRNLLEEYMKEFRDPEGLKKAVVMSEILKRKF